MARAQARPPQVERITLRPHGFEPRQVQRGPGRFLLAVDNRSRLDLAILRLDSDAGGHLRELRLPRGKLRWREFLTLPPGRYVLSEANHPAWVCQILISAQ